MAHYAIGDVQGCYTELMTLLDSITFNEHEDTLWFAGDIINGGPDNLAVLRFIQAQKSIVVLGNHDLHFLSVFHGVRTQQPDDTFQDILNAPDVDELSYWLQSQPLAHYDAFFNTLMVHAGIGPTWSLENTLSYAKKIELALNPAKHSESDIRDFFLAIFGSSQKEPDKTWREITDTLTRIRFCDNTGRLNLSYKGNISQAPTGLYPWFDSPVSTKYPMDILFGHWAALEGKTAVHSRLFALDTGCVWGGKLTALRLEDKKLFQITGKKYR